MLRATLSAILLLLVSLTAALEQLKQVDVHVWPVSESKPQLFATVEYNSTTATIKSSAEPSIPSTDDLVRIGYFSRSGGLLSSSDEWSGIVTAASNLAAEKEKVILIHLDSTSTAYHVGFKAVSRVKAVKSVAEPGLRAEVVPLNPAPVVRLNKPVVLAADGQMEKSAEKTFLQKYWWAIAAFLVLQVVMGGAGGAAASGDKKD